MTPSDPTNNVSCCLIALQFSGFNLEDFDNYNRWMDESTIMQIADTGKCLGPEGIQE